MLKATKLRRSDSVRDTCCSTCCQEQREKKIAVIENERVSRKAGAGVKVWRRLDSN